MYKALTALDFKWLISPVCLDQKEIFITNQAMMGETWDEVKSWSKKGYFGVEMETSTLFAVSNHFNVPATALVYVSDNLIKGQTSGDETHIRQKRRS